MARRSTKVPDHRKTVLAKLEKAGAKGSAESALIGKSEVNEALNLLRELVKEGLAIKVGSDINARWFGARYTPSSVAEAVEKECANRSQSLWIEEDVLKKLPKFYSQSEAATALKKLCAGPQVVRVKVAKVFKNLYLPGKAASDEFSRYFVSDSARLIYALVVLDGENQQKELGLNPSHYRDQRLAKSWRDSVARLVHPDICSHPKAHEAADQLDRIYRRMTG